MYNLHMGRKRIHVTQEAWRESRREANRQYRRRQRALNPLQPKPTPAERFWSKVSKGEGCWIWTAALNEHGYGMFRSGGQMRLAHRVAWELTSGTPPPRQACHSCDHPACVRPDHLFDGGQRENMADARQKGRTVKSGTVPKPVPPLRSSRQGEQAPNARLTWTQVREIRTRYPAGETLAQLGIAYGVSLANVWAIVTHRTWRGI